MFNRTKQVAVKHFQTQLVAKKVKFTFPVKYVDQPFNAHYRASISDDQVKIRVAICVALEAKIFSFFLIYNNLIPLRLYFGSHVFSNFTIVGNGDRSVQELQNSVLDCLNMQPR